MNYDEALAYIHATLKFGSKLGLHNIGKLLKLMGDPQNKLRFVHIAGTNGKGSTVAFISSILVESGYRVGVYTSPYIQRFTERIRIGNNEINPGDLARITTFVKQKVDRMLEMGENHPTEFEIVTAIAFQYYFEMKCDVVVLEVGLGGRYDSTNIIETPELAVITTISYDHTEWLGSGLTQIAFEKAGIIKPGGDVIVYGQDAEVTEVFSKVSTERGARLQIVDFSSLRPEGFSLDGQKFSFEDHEGLEISLLGEHQLKNASVAVKAAELLMGKGWRITESTLRSGLANTRWPGRLEILSRKPLLLIDAAHNIEGARVLRTALDEYFPGRKFSFIMGVSNDKDYKAMAKTVITRCTRIITVTPNSVKALPASVLSDAVSCYCNEVQVSDTIEEAVRTSLAAVEPDEVICAFGSLYYIGAVRDYYRM